MSMHNLGYRLISMVFHPLLMPSLAIYLMFVIPSYVSFSVSGQAQRLIIIIVFINTCVAPMLAILFLKKMGLVSELSLNNRADRIYPALVSVLLYFFTYYLFKQANLPSLLNFFVLGATFLVLTGFVISMYWKISLHMMSMGGFTGYLIVVSLLLTYEMPLLIISSILVSGLLGTARLKLNAHKPSQVYVGYLTGISIMFLLFFYLRA